MCSADGFVNAHRRVASAALAPRSAPRRKEGGDVDTSFSDAHSVNERVSCATREGFNFRPDRRVVQSERDLVHAIACSSRL